MESVLGVYQCYVIFQKICSYKIRQPTFFGKRRVLDSLDCNLIRNSCYVACFSCRQLMESVSLFLFRKSRGGCHFEDHLKALSYFAHEWHLDPELDEWDVGEGAAYDEDESVDVLHLGVVDDGSDHQEERDQQDRDGDHDRTLVGPCKVRSSFPEDKQGQHCHGVEEGDREAEEINQTLDVPTNYHHRCDYTIENKGWRWREVFLVYE